MTKNKSLRQNNHVTKNKLRHAASNDICMSFFIRFPAFYGHRWYFLSICHVSQTIEDEKKIINKINRNQNQQIAAKKKNVSTGITGVFWGTKLKHHLKGQIFTGESGSCMQLVTAFCIAMGFGGKKNKNITHHQGEMYIVIQEQNDLKWRTDLKYIHLNCIDVF